MKQPAAIVLLVLLTVGSFLLLRDLEKTLEPAIEDENIRQLAVAYEVKGRYYGSDNQLRYNIASDSVVEFSNSAGTKINSPNVQVFDAKKQLSWQGRANVAFLSADKETLKLDGEVKIIKSPNSERELRASSEKMIYHADKREVNSQRPVLVETDLIQQTASNFRLAIDEQKVYFDGAIKGSYAPVGQAE